MPGCPVSEFAECFCDGQLSNFRPGMKAMFAHFRRFFAVRCLRKHNHESFSKRSRMAWPLIFQFSTKPQFCHAQCLLFTLINVRRQSTDVLLCMNQDISIHRVFLSAAMMRTCFLLLVPKKFGIVFHWIEVHWSSQNIE